MLRERREGYARASTLPFLRSVYIDLEGNCWLEPFSPGGSTTPFHLFSRDGTWLGEVSLPPGHHRNDGPGGIRGAPSFQIGDDYVLGCGSTSVESSASECTGLKRARPE